jgi:hypothetical protein
VHRKGHRIRLWGEGSGEGGAALDSLLRPERRRSWGEAPDAEEGKFRNGRTGVRSHQAVPGVGEEYG